ncbi:MAG: MFS transporter [Acidobacteria bacterium]|nr:MFS transporter [Acidobacteriota bacterium]
MHSWKRNQAAITAAAFVGFVGFTLVMPFLPLYFRELGLTEVGDISLWTGVTLGVSPAIAALTGPLWGRIGDRFGNKILIQRSLVSFIVVLSAMAFITRPWHLFALRALQGFFAGYGPLTLSMAALSAPPHKMASAIGTVQTAQRMGPALGPVIGGLLAPAVGLRNTFLVAAGFYFVALVMITTLYQEPARSSQPVKRRPRTPFASILAFENFLVVMLVLFGLQLVDRSFGPVLALHLGQLGYAANDIPVLAGVLFSVLAFAAALGNQISGRALDRQQPRVIIIVATLMAASALAVFALSSTTWLMTATMSIVGLGIGTAITTAYTAGGAVIPRDVHATAFGFLTSASLVGIALSPALSGLLGAQSIRAVFVAGVVILIAIAIVVVRGMVDRDSAAAAQATAPATAPATATEDT